MATLLVQSIPIDDLAQRQVVEKSDKVLAMPCGTRGRARGGWLGHWFVWQPCLADKRYSVSAPLRNTPPIRDEFA